MLPGALTVQDDGTLTVVQRPDEDTAAFEATLSRFTELVCPTAGQRVYRLTAASIWRARRAGLTLEEVLQTLETSSTTALPPHVRADLERWSRQIDRLTLEADQGRLLLRSTHPLALTAVQRHRTLGTFITHQLDAATAALRADAYPELVQTFDACGYPVLDHVPGGWTPDATPALPVARPVRPVVEPRPVQMGGRRKARVEGLHRLPRQDRQAWCGPLGDLLFRAASQRARPWGEGRSMQRCLAMLVDTRTSGQRVCLAERHTSLRRA